MLVAVIWGFAFITTLIPPLPSLALSLAIDGPASLARAVPASSWAGLASALYLGLVATVFAYAVWGDLLRRYPAATVAPFALLVPFVAALASSVVFGERFGPARLAGMAFVLLGLVFIALPPRGRTPPRAGTGHDAGRWAAAVFEGPGRPLRLSAIRSSSGAGGDPRPRPLVDHLWLRRARLGRAAGLPRARHPGA